jgi:dolichyl-diphosphooligosaccharide--protein glycosyltransferase
MALAALAIVIYRAFRRGETEVLLLAVWSIVTLLSALAMRRFAYYLAINVAVLAGYAGWLILSLCGLDQAPAAVIKAPLTKKAGRKKTAGARGQGKSTGASRLALGIAAVAALVVYPNTGPLPGGDKPFFDVATRALYAPSDAWCQSMDWLRINTPEPFGDAGYYYARYNEDGVAHARPAAYSVLCWWDYGYWVSRIGHRVPFSNPGTSNRYDDRSYFISRSAGEAEELRSKWDMRYVIVNSYMVDRDSGFRVLAAGDGHPASNYSEIYYRSKQDKLAPTLLYYPEYYRTMAVRLYCFDGKAYMPLETAVISWEAKTGADGLAYKEITGLKTYGSYAEAEVFLAAQKTGNWRIVGKDPLASPVPLEALEGYRPAFASPQKARLGNNEIAEVKIFEYQP